MGNDDPQVKIIDNVTDEKWQEILSKSNTPTFFHTKKWLEILAKSFDGCSIKAHLYLFDDSTEVLFPAITFPCLKSLMNSYFSSYTGVYGGLMCIKPISPKRVKMIMDTLFKGRTAGVYIYHSPFMKLGLPDRFKKHTHFTHMISLDNNFDYIWEKLFSHYQRKKIRRAEKSGVKVVDGKSKEDIKAFYALYEKGSERWGDRTTWIRPYEFCRNSILLGEGNTKFKLAMLGEKVIAGAVDHYYGNHMFSAWRAFDYDYRNYFANNLVVKEVIREACQEGLKYYDMGASAGLKGVIEFKESFGAVQTSFDIYAWENPLYKLYKKVRKAIQYA